MQWNPNECSREFFEAAAQHEMSAAWRESDHGPLEQMHRDVEPAAWFAAGVILISIVAAVSLVAWRFA